MKRNGLLIFTLLGLIALEYGCRKDPVPPNISCDKNQDMAAVGIRDLYSYKETIGIRTEITEGETIAYDSFEIGIEIDTKHITQVAHLNYGAYAIMAATSPLCWPLDSIQIEGISTSRSINLSSSFNVRSTYALDDTIPVTND